MTEPNNKSLTYAALTTFWPNLEWPTGETIRRCLCYLVVCGLLLALQVYRASGWLHAEQHPTATQQTNR